MRRTEQVKRDGIMLNCGPDQSPTVRNGIYKGGYEGPERMLLKRYLKPGASVLELGAGIGFVGMLAARIAGAGKVVSYEANPELEETIRANYALNMPLPELRMRAITTDGCPITFHQSDNVVSSSLYDRPECTRKLQVESDALDKVIDELHPDWLIIDVEGYEVDLLAAPPTGPRTLLIELHPHIVGVCRTEEMLDGLKRTGFRLVDRLQNNVVLTR